MAARFVLSLGLATFCMLVSLAPGEAQAHERFQFSPPPGWRKEGTLSKNEEAYVRLDSMGKAIARVSVQWQTMTKAITRRPSGEYQTSDFDGLFLKARPLALTNFGFKDWKIDQSKLELISEKGSSGYLYQVQGSYEQPNQSKTIFLEQEYFIGKDYYQITWTQDKNRFGDEQSKEAQQVLARFKPL